MNKLLVEGWRGISHSYAMVNQYQLLELRKNSIDLRFKDIPFYRQEWADERNHSGFSRLQMEEIYSIPSPGADEKIEVNYRIGFPYFMHPSNCEKLFVFGTSEFQRITEGMIFQGASKKNYKQLDLNIITPSNWSKIGFINAGFDQEHIKVIPHGVDFSIYKPLGDAGRLRYRNLIGAGKDNFVILSIGAMSDNKGIDLLLMAYLELHNKYPQIKLVLKDQRGIHGVSAQDLVRQICAAKNINISSGAASEALAKIVFIGQNLNLEQLNGLYGAADLYVSPYRAEGFNMPPLEAAAAGTPILVTAGGSTDDYVDNSFAMKIDSQIKHDGDTTFLEPDYESLVKKISIMIEGGNSDINYKRAVEFISKDFTWCAVVKKMLNEFGM